MLVLAVCGCSALPGPGQDAGRPAGPTTPAAATAGPPTAAAPTTRTAPAAPDLALPPGAQQVRVVRHVDGDTVVLAGRGTGPVPPRAERVRVIGVDTPELRPEECLGPEAAARTAALLPVGTTARATAQRGARDRYGRPLADVWTADGRLLAQLLVREGLATVLTVGADDRYATVLEREEAAARARRAGLWGACPVPR